MNVRSTLWTIVRGVMWALLLAETLFIFKGGGVEVLLAFVAPMSWAFSLGFQYGIVFKEGTRQ